MGLLDDAIREHLELKRKHGADRDAVEQQEHEVFGQEPLVGASTADLTEPVTGAPEPVPHVPEQAPAVEPDARPAALSPAVPPLAADPTPALAHQDSGQPTVEFSVEDYLAQEPADSRQEHAVTPEEPGDGDDDDLLEGTPDFLQETPEHDRLWFEQKPPRDFDFDG